MIVFSSLRLIRFFTQFFDDATAVKHSLRSLLGAVLVVVGASAAFAEERVDRCIFCVQFNDAATYLIHLDGQPVVSGPTNQRYDTLIVALHQDLKQKVSVNALNDGMTADRALEAMKRTDLICDGVRLKVDGFSFQNNAGIVTLPFPAVFKGGTLCVGTVTTVDEYRERPFKKFFDGEKKAVLERIVGIEQLASKDMMRATLKDLLESDLKAQRATMVGEVAAEAVRILEQPGIKKR